MGTTVVIGIHALWLHEKCMEGELMFLLKDLDKEWRTP